MLAQNFGLKDKSSLSDSSHPKFWIFFSIFILGYSIIGSLLVRFYSDSFLLSIMVVLIALVPILVAFDKIPSKIYPFLLFVIGLSLLLCIPLETGSLWGADNHGEYYFANLVETSGFWNSTISNSYNAMVSVTILGPVLSTFSGMSLLWVFKIIYPLIFSIISLVLFSIFRAQIDDKSSFLAVFFIISLSTFYTEMLGLARQMIAEVFLVLILYLLFKKRERNYSPKDYLFLAIFGLGFVLSHYTLAYLFVGITIFVLVLSLFKKKVMKTHIVFASYLGVLIICWYVLIAQGVVFERFINLLFDVFGGVVNNFSNPDFVQPLNILLTSKASLLHEITRILNLVMVGVITLGVLGALSGRIGKKLSNEYKYFALANFLLCGFSLVVPFVASSLNTSRLYHISLLILAPFFVFGVILCFNVVFRLLSRKISFSFSKSLSIKFISVFLCVFLLFNTGFMYHVTNSRSSILNPTWALSEGSLKDKVSLYNSFVPKDEMLAALWIKNCNTSLQIYSDYRSRNNALNAFGMLSRAGDVNILYSSTKIIDSSSLVFLRRLNIFDGVFETGRDEKGVTQLFNGTQLIDTLSENANLIYCSGGSMIYYTPSKLEITLVD
ncbi:MAG: DUF2206 domain-containing protein [Clostridiales bacterium]|nr:DUF2206 domain-containing protein [Clostridiales bacterium]